MSLSKKRLLQAASVMKRVGDAAKEQAEYNVKEVIGYIKKELVFANTAGLVNHIEQARKRITLPWKKNNVKEIVTYALNSFDDACTKSGLEKAWISLLRYHLGVLEHALKNLRKSDSQIAKNANALSEAAFKYTILTDAFSKSDLRGNPLKTFCAGILNDLVPTQGDLSKAFPTAQADEDVQIFCHKVEWTDLLYKIEPCTVLSGDSLSAIIDVGKHFAQCGVKPDEVDRAGKVKEQINKVLKQDMKQVMARYAANALGLSAGHWFACPNGHLYAIGDCGGATQESVCPECKSKIGGYNYNLAPNNTSARGLIEGMAIPGTPTALSIIDRIGVICDAFTIFFGGGVVRIGL